MSALAGRPFLKMNGIGNEIVVVDLRGTSCQVSAQEARAIHAAPHLAYDQLMVIQDPRAAGTEAFVRILNNDGSEAGACGNGTRCVAWALMRATERARLTVETKRGLLACSREGEWTFTVDMGAPLLAWDQIPLRDPFFDTSGIELQIGPIDAPVLHTPAVANMGNPHAVFFVKDIAAYDLPRFGPLLENHPIFPERANISLCEVVSPTHLRLRVWERGVGITQACGSAACAALVSAVRRDLADRKATVSLPGGDLVIEWRERDGHVLMTGAVELEFESAFDPGIFEGQAA